VTYRLLPAAIDDLDDIDLWTIEHFGVSVADKTQAKLFATFSLLAASPQLGHQRPDVTTRPVRFFSLSPFWIIYEPASPLLIHRVFHSARDLTRLGEDLTG
jgi:plasmid stabilization system protein ParE